MYTHLAHRASGEESKTFVNRWAALLKNNLINIDNIKPTLTFR